MTAVCAVCGNERGNRTHTAQEMMLGLRTPFTYLECDACGCLQLATPPEDFAPYYPSGYYSFGAPKNGGGLLCTAKRYLREVRNKAFLNRYSLLGGFLGRISPYPALRGLACLQLGKDARILDVGCGSGEFLLDLRRLGFGNLLGIDPFVREDIRYANGVRVRKGTLADLKDTTWDVIIFNHSFEHLPEQRSTLKLVSQLLSPDGHCIIREPVVAWPWKKYGTCWVELDAPRHTYLHTEKSMQILTDQAGLKITGVEYDSSEFQFWGSELYLRDIPLSAADPTTISRTFSKQELRRFDRESKRLNREHQGGRAAFYLKAASNRSGRAPEALR